MPLGSYSTDRETNSTIPPGDIRAENLWGQQLVNAIRQLMADLAGVFQYVAVTVSATYFGPAGNTGYYLGNTSSVGYTRIWGGPGTGANILLFGPSHATNANEAYYNAEHHTFRTIAAANMVTIQDIQTLFGAAGNTGYHIGNVSTLGLLDIRGGPSSGARVLLFAAANASFPSEAFYDAQEHHFRTVAGSEHGTINSGGAFIWTRSGVNHYFESNMLWGQNTTTIPGLGNNVTGAAIRGAGDGFFSMAGPAVYGNRTADGVVYNVASAGVVESSISIAGAVGTFNAFMGSHWAQLFDNSMPDIWLGTICESIAQMSLWPGEGVGSNQRLPCFKISDKTKSKAVYGVFAWWDIDDPMPLDEKGNPIPDNRIFMNDALIGALGAFVVRMHSSADPEIGDWIESNGDGTGRVQKSASHLNSSVAKITSTQVQWVYPDGSYLLPCTLHCG